MKILLCNDDGIFAPGLKKLIDVLGSNHDLTVVAPDSERSAVSHGLTIRRPLFVREWQFDKAVGYAVSGTPADCVKLGLDSLISGDRPDLVVSGINNGANTGINVFYSGTVAAAFEATFVGIPAMAISIDSFHPEHYDTAALIAESILMQIQSIPGNIVMNVNVPDVKLSQVAGVRVTNQSKISYNDRYIRRVSPNGQSYYWLDGDRQDDIDNLDYDDCAVKKNWVSVTPLTADFNLEKQMAQETDRWLRKISLPIKSCS